jgi:hypothetical protein
MFAAGQLRRSLRLDNSFPSAAHLPSTTQSWPSHLYPGHSLPTPTPCATNVRGPSTSGCRTASAARRRRSRARALGYLCGDVARPLSRKTAVKYVKTVVASVDGVAEQFGVAHS